MRDPRLTTLADVLCRYSLQVEEGDTVLIDGPPLAQPLFVEVVRTVTELGAHPMVRTRLERAQAAFLAEAGDAQLRAITRLDEIEVEAPTRALSIWGQRNNRFSSGIDPDRQATRSAATRTLFLREGWIGDVGTISLIVTVVGVVGAIAIWRAALALHANFLFERPAAFWIAPGKIDRVLQAAE